MEEAAQGLPRRAGNPVRPDRPQTLRGRRPADRARCRRCLAREGISVADRTTLHFGLGKALLDIGDSVEAFRHYDEGNRLKRTTFAYDPDADERWMAQSPRVSSPALLSERRRTRARAQTCRSSSSACRARAPRSSSRSSPRIRWSIGAGELKTLHALIDGSRVFPPLSPLRRTRFKALGEAYLAYVAPMAPGGGMWSTRCRPISCSAG